MSEITIKRAADWTPKVIVEVDGRVLSALETFSPRHAELVSYDIALLATRINPAAKVIFRPPLDCARCRPAWGRTQQLLAGDQPIP